MAPNRNCQVLWLLSTALFIYIYVIELENLVMVAFYPEIQYNTILKTILKLNYSVYHLLVNTHHCQRNPLIKTNPVVTLGVVDLEHDLVVLLPLDISLKQSIKRTTVNRKI